MYVIDPLCKKAAVQFTMVGNCCGVAVETVSADRDVQTFSEVL